MRETWICINCVTAKRPGRIELDKHGRCPICGSDQVLSEAAIKIQTSPIMNNGSSTNDSINTTRTTADSSLADSSLNTKHNTKYNTKYDRYIIVDSKSGFWCVVFVDKNKPFKFNPCENHVWHHPRFWSIDLDQEFDKDSISSFTSFLIKEANSPEAVIEYESSILFDVSSD
jgi:hypothetical protein